MRCRTITSSVATLSISGVLASQSFLVVPPGFDIQEAVNMGVVAGLEQRFRHQYLVNSSGLTAMQGKHVQALWFRRDVFDGRPMPAIASVLRLQISYAAMSPAAPSSTLARNRGPVVTQVFSGTLNLAAAPPVGAGPAPWAPPSAFRLPFTPTFLYQGGDLCIEVDGDPPNPSPIAKWWIDYEREADVGTVLPYGQPCGAATSGYVQTQNAWGANLVPGGTFCLWSVGQPNTPAVLLLGAQPTAIPLDPIGATGCTLLVQPQIELPVGTYWRPHPAGLKPYQSLTFCIDLPSTPSLLSVRFFSQFANVENGSSQSNLAGLTLTNALDLTTGARMPPGSISTIVTGAVPPGAPFPATGRVDISRGPVLRFEY